MGERLAKRVSAAAALAVAERGAFCIAIAGGSLVKVRACPRPHTPTLALIAMFPHSQSSSFTPSSLTATSNPSFPPPFGYPCTTSVHAHAVQHAYACGMQHNMSMYNVHVCTHHTCI